MDAQHTGIIYLGVSVRMTGALHTTVTIVLQYGQPSSRLGTNRARNSAEREPHRSIKLTARPPQPEAPKIGGRSVI